MVIVMDARRGESSTSNRDNTIDVDSKPSDTNIQIKKIKTTTDLQRLKLEKLQKKHAENKDVFIPDRPKERKLRDPLEFIRNIWGSSAGVGSGDFDVYRGIRRREYARHKFILQKSAKEDLDDVYKQKVQQNIIDAEQRTAKKREKRQKKKQRTNANKKKKPIETEHVKSDSSDEDTEEDNGDTVARGDDVRVSCDETVAGHGDELQKPDECEADNDGKNCDSDGGSDEDQGHRDKESDRREDG